MLSRDSRPLYPADIAHTRFVLKHLSVEQHRVDIESEYHLQNKVRDAGNVRDEATYPCS